MKVVSHIPRDAIVPGAAERRTEDRVIRGGACGEARG